MRKAALAAFAAIAFMASAGDHVARRTEQKAFEKEVRARNLEELRHWSSLAAQAMTNAVVATLTLQYGIPHDRAWECYTNVCGAASSARSEVWRKRRQMREVLQPDLNPDNTTTKGNN